MRTVSVRPQLQPSESSIQRAILEFLKLSGFVCWRNNTGFFTKEYKGKTHAIRYGEIGSGDIIGLTRKGRFFSIEVKKPGQKPTSHQAAFINRVRTSGGIAFVATSVDDVLSFAKIY